MKENEIESEDLERLCQGVSPGDAACNYPATVHCPTCSGATNIRVAPMVRESWSMRLPEEYSSNQF